MDTRRDNDFIFAMRKSQVSNIFLRVRRFCSKTASRFHDLVSNDPILDPKVVPDELGPLAEPGWPGLASQAARSCRRGPGWPPPGGPGHHSTDPRTAENAEKAMGTRKAKNHPRPRKCYSELLVSQNSIIFCATDPFVRKG